MNGKYENDKYVEVEIIEERLCRIEEIAKRANMSQSSVRRYVKLGLITPVNKERGCYLLKETVVSRIARIQRLKRDLGVNLAGTEDVEIIEELAPTPDERVFYNWPFGVFRENDLERYLRDQGVETVVLTGVATGMAIGHASFSLADRLFSLIVPSDTCADERAELHRTVLEQMLPPIGLITTTEDVLAHL